MNSNFKSLNFCKNIFLLSPEDSSTPKVFDYLIIGLAIFIFELMIFIANLIIFYSLKADYRRRKAARRQARRLKTISNQVQESEKEEVDRDVGEFVFKMIDTGKLAVH